MRDDGYGGGGCCNGSSHTIATDERRQTRQVRVMRAES